jgi:hypothetical protein
MNTTFQTMNTMFRMMDYQAGNIGAWGKGTLARTRLIVHMIFIVVLATRMEITLRDSGKSQKLDTNRPFDFWPHL